MKIEDFKCLRNVFGDEFTFYSKIIGDINYIIDCYYRDDYYVAYVDIIIDDKHYKNVFTRVCESIDECLLAFDNYNKENNINCE